MTDWRKAVVHLPATIRDVAESLEKSSTQLVLATSGDDRLVGVINDGDIRRGLLRGETLDSPVETIMNTQFIAVREEDSPALTLTAMREKEIRQIPVLDGEGRLVGLRTLMDMTVPPRRDNWVVLMAGGLGQRLRPLTEDCPKPLLSVGGKPLLETILNQFIEYGFHRFYISVNYRAEMIEDYFGDGSKFGIEIRYLREDDQLGTAGALGLLPSSPQEPVFVMNGDLLTRVDFPGMLDFHFERGASATMAVRNFEMQVPLRRGRGGRPEDRQPLGKARAPVLRQRGHLRALARGRAVHPRNGYLDMPTLFSQLNEAGKTTAAFPIHEYWMDIGRKQDFDQANCDYNLHFQSVEER